MTADRDEVLARTRRWLERAVIGLNLCPFAKSVYIKGQVRFVVCDATQASGVLGALGDELRLLAGSDADAHDTTLLVVPGAFGDFLEFNDLLGAADRLLRKLGLDGVLQLASFHPRYQFAGTQADDITNFTNRAPFPTLHLLRESSIDRAVAAFPDAAEIYEANMATLRRLGHAGWADLNPGCKP